jgi:inhibitor of KinA sporulation pathway (predicted exonuclease)
MTRLFPDKFALLDTEYNSTKDRKPMAPEHDRAIFQIAVIVTDNQEMRKQWEYMAYVSASHLTDFVQELTGVSQETVDEKGIPLERALAEIERQTRELPIYCYGGDGDVIQQNCARLGITCPIAPERFINLKPLLAPVLIDIGIDPKEYSSGQLYQAFGLSGGRAHDALNDMQNLHAVLRELRVRGRL